LNDAVGAFSLLGLPWGKLAAVVALGCAGLLLAFRQWQRFRRLEGEAPETDELEARLRARELALLHSLSLKGARVAGRVVLAGGTALGLVELTQGGFPRLPQAALIFTVGAACWAGCQELARRLGSPAGAGSRGSTRSGPDQPD
jgi:hypothetical protein